MLWEGTRTGGHQTGKKKGDSFPTTALVAAVGPRHRASPCCFNSLAERTTRAPNSRPMMFEPPHASTATVRAVRCAKAEPNGDRVIRAFCLTNNLDRTASPTVTDFGIHGRSTTTLTSASSHANTCKGTVETRAENQVEFPNPNNVIGYPYDGFVTFFKDRMIDALLSKLPELLDDLVVHRLPREGDHHDYWDFSDHRNGAVFEFSAGNFRVHV